ncbi:hypothetical protein JL720_10545 [Aureococcus anophagefferens]|nr:hypothetical protein JL720_10545 [Aureococcus anophagefferens]
MSMVANLVGAIGCILGNKHIMSTHARMPLTLTFLGYGFVILYFVVANRLRPGRRPRAQVDVESEAEPRARVAGLRPLASIVCLVLIHAGVFVASVSDVTLNRIGCFVAFANVVVTALQDGVVRGVARRHRQQGARRGGRGGRTDAAEARDEQAAVRELVEATLPAAALALLPAMAYFEGGVLLNCWRTMDAAAYARLGVVAVLGAWTSSTGYMVIGRLSALTHQILGQFKMCCLLFGSYAFLGADLNGRQLSGASLTMAAVLLYTRATIKQRAAPPPKAKRREEDAPLLADDDDRGVGLSPERIRRASSLRRSSRSSRDGGFLFSRGVASFVWGAF